MIGKKSFDLPKARRSVIISKGNVHDVLAAFLLSIRAIEADEFVEQVRFSSPKYEDGHYVVSVKGKD